MTLQQDLEWCIAQSRRAAEEWLGGMRHHGGPELGMVDFVWEELLIRKEIQRQDDTTLL